MKRPLDLLLPSPNPESSGPKSTTIALIAIEETQCRMEVGKFYLFPSPLAVFVLIPVVAFAELPLVQREFPSRVNRPEEIRFRPGQRD